jgi:ferredoxin
MKGLICYFSTTGNTKLACDYIVRKIPWVPFDFVNIARQELPDLESYDVVGFAAFTDFLGLPRLMIDYIHRIPMQHQKPAFVFNTYGNVSGRTLKDLAGLASRRGFRIITGHSLQTPENYPPLIAGGLANTQFPNEKQFIKFHQFIIRLDQALAAIDEGRAQLRPAPRAKIRIGFFNRLIPPISRKLSRKMMGCKWVAPALCTHCGICKRLCPYQAISLNPGPVFNEERCYGCWSCYNHCPTKAIYTKKLKNTGHYPKPPEILKEKFKPDETSLQDKTRKYII